MIPKRKRNGSAEEFAAWFWSNTRQDGECVVWTRALSRKGYGHLRVGAGTERRTMQAHRVAFQISKGDIAPGLVVMHSCDNRRCVRPEHLSVGTIADNNHDAQRKGRMYVKGAWTTPRHCKLTLDQVIEIRQRLVRAESLAGLGRSFGVSRSTICRIRSGATWGALVVTVEQLIAKLEREQYETDDPGHSALELAGRRGWNNRARELIACLRLEAGLTEIKTAQAMDLRFKAALTGFDTSDGGEEG